MKLTKAQREVLERMAQTNALANPRYSEWNSAAINRRFWFVNPDGSKKFYGHSTYAPLHRDGLINLRGKYIGGLDHWAIITDAGRILTSAAKSVEPPKE